MSIYDVLLIILALLTLTLSILLYNRHRREKRVMAVFNSLKPEQFSDFLMKNSLEGSIVDVARKVSELLINNFGCRYIIFLRKKRNLLELNYYHGVRRFNKEDFQVQFSKELNLFLKKDFLPQPVEDLKEFFSESYLGNLKEQNLDKYFPIFWRDNLYGIYFIKSTIATETISFKVLIGAVAQSLSAAYHIKWHESKLENLQKQVNEYTKITGRSQENNEEVTRILKLMKHRRIDSILPKLLSTLKDVARFEKTALIYDLPNKNVAPVIIKDNLGGNLQIPDRNDFEYLNTLLRKDEIVSLSSLSSQFKNNPTWIKSMKSQGMEYLSAFPLTKSRKAVLVWNGGISGTALKEDLRSFKSHSSHLLENAEDYEKIEEMSYTDGLTGLANQRYFFKRLSEEINRAGRYKRNLALIIFDIDELKTVNDKYGHLAGDSLISQIGNLLKNSIRAIDVVARYGGDEFCIVMPEADLEMCKLFMDRFLKKISNTMVKIENSDEKVCCTVSIGAAIYPEHGENSKNLIFAADMALLKAKESGRNQYRTAESGTKAN